MKSREIRKQFLDFFNDKGHAIVPSAPMVIKDDPTLMFTNAGMNQFKEFFLGNKAPKNNRVTDTQKCLRVSGKHNDLEEVGKDTYHHTMFEMLGNWSFGDYFKKDAIAWAWELLTKIYKIDKDILYVTVFEGADAEGLPVDQEAYDLWKAIVPEDRIILGNKNDNFWEMGDQGPCGPSSEIHVDIRSEEEKAKTPGKDLVNQDHPQVVEIWNLVFMEFNRKADGSLEKLPAQHVDTGMGFERLCMVLQDKKSNYDTDVFTPLIREIETITNAKYNKEEEINIAIRVIADHVRAVSFAIADGQLPSNTGAGYVIRRILRRAIRYGFTFLNQKEPFIYKLVDTLIKQMHEFFPELKKEKNIIVNVIKEEESSFLRTLAQGLVLLDNIISTNDGKIISGAKAFELYDTYGFPIDLTALILEEKGYGLDEEGFLEELEKQKNRSRAATKVETGDWEVLIDDPIEEFVGYDTLETQVRLTRYRKVASKKEGEMYQLVFNITPFYAEGGGQVGDKGYLESPNGDVVYIIDTKKENNLIIHLSKNLPKNLNDTFKAVVDTKQRNRTAANHTATHLLHQALRSVLGSHVEQKGSMVHSGYLRFDFSHFSKVTAEELTQVEDFVNARIREQLPLQENRATPFQEAVNQGAMALFGEKYGDLVRTVKFGESIELCGGTHVKNTGDIWHFIITGESAVAAGVRRIEAITFDAAKEYFANQTDAYNQVKAVLKSNATDPVKAITALQDENIALKKQVEQLLKDKAKGLKTELKAMLEDVNGVKFLATKVALDQGSIKDLAFEMGNEYNNLYLLFASENDGKVMLTCYVSKEMVKEKNLNAGQIVRELGKLIQGGGGGQPFFATAGGRNPEGIPEALKKAKDYIL
ncbi:alanine--tRNA ligase [Galbibacter pacificus]|uniref:Alanine--tRNA ligase n=1 Tax=Galbibacter pacificus TaxID=2996052 RepID=A0ABT6FVY8_9FLAO|nr:alanine--tRNA ligase [Galbibacter pacificus]MDG3584137.1 alanine--tRNA ligase [Galbibacter pacificus]MDG3587430.1 alanine--tRNA ligase [Galbibacter pacificus]